MSRNLYLLEGQQIRLLRYLAEQAIAPRAGAVSEHPAQQIVNFLDLLLEQGPSERDEAD